MKYFCEENRQKPPHKRGAEADIAVYIKPLIAVIPVFHLEQPFHGPSGDVLQSRSGYDTGDIYQKQAVPERQGDPQHHHRPCAVEGEQGQAQESPVDRPFFPNGHIGGFKNPAGKAVYIEKAEPLIPGVVINVHGNLLKTGGRRHLESLDGRLLSVVPV